MSEMNRGDCPENPAFALDLQCNPGGNTFQSLKFNMVYNKIILKREKNETI